MSAKGLRGDRPLRRQLGPSGRHAAESAGNMIAGGAGESSDALSDRRASSLVRRAGGRLSCCHAELRPPRVSAPTGGSAAPLSPTALFGDDPHRRLNILTGEWVLVSPHRMKRPWQGQIEEIPPDDRPAYDPKCYLCPGNERAGGHRNPNYTGPWAFDNDFAALRPGESGRELNTDGLLVARQEPGICRVICFSPRHDLSLPEMEAAAIRGVV